MKLDPVYVVAPRPQVSTRRAFLLAGATGGLGLAAGFAGGYWAAASRASPHPSPPEANARIEWARNLVAAHDDAVLLENLPAFLGVMHEAHQLGLDDAALWDGVRRAGAKLVLQPETAQRRLEARALLTILNLRPDDPGLRDLRRRIELATRR